MNILGKSYVCPDLKNTQYVYGLKHYIRFHKYVKVLSFKREKKNPRQCSQYSICEMWLLVQDSPTKSGSYLLEALCCNKSHGPRKLHNPIPASKIT